MAKNIFTGFKSNMKIQPVNINNNYSFQARKKEIRKADDIVRKVNNEFPAFSTTFATGNWNVLERKDCYLPLSIRSGIRKERDKFYAEVNKDKFALTVFDTIKETKIGNCSEKNWLTLGALAANGYYDSFRISAQMKWNVIDKRNGKKVFAKDEDIDHDLILTTMNNTGDNTKDAVIVDGWLNKAMSFSEAKTTYFSMIKEKEMEEMKDRVTREFITLNKDNEINLNNYEFIPQISFTIPKNYLFNIKNKEDMIEFGEIIAQKYPILVFKENK